MEDKELEVITEDIIEEIAECITEEINDMGKGEEDVKE